MNTVSRNERNHGTYKLTPEDKEYIKSFAKDGVVSFSDYLKAMTIILNKTNRKGWKEIMKNYNGCITALMNYDGIIFDMGLEDQDGKPTFYILTEDLNHIRVTITDAMSIVSVCSWLESLNTDVDIEFKDFYQFRCTIQAVFKVYGARIGNYMHYDNTFLNSMKKSLHVSDKAIASVAGVGKSTVNDLTRGLTKHPKFYTVARIHSALFKLNEKGQN